MNENTTHRAQSAMEYLMTYGWAILVILVVLGILYLLHVFSPSSIVGTQCNVNFNYLCTNPSLATNGTISFIAGQNTEVPEYNVAFACTASTNTSSGGPYTNGTSPWYYMNNSLSLSRNFSISNAYTLQSGYKIQINNLPCFGTTGYLLSNGRFLQIQTSFSGILWIRYTGNAGAPDNATNKLITKQLATVSLSATVNSTSAYGASTTAHSTTTIYGTTTAPGKSSTVAATTTGTTTAPGSALLPISSPLLILIAIVVIIIIVVILYLRNRML